MVPEIFQSCHNGRHPGFVVRPQKGGAIGEQDILAPVLFDLREIFRGKQDLFVPVQQDVFPIIIPDQEGFPVVLKGHLEDTVGVGQSSDDKRGTLMWFKVDDALRSALFEGCTLDPNRLGFGLLSDELLSNEMYVRCLKDALQLNP